MKIRTYSIAVEATTAEQLCEKMNQIQEEKNVFASQTHYKGIESITPWAAIIFIRERVE